MLERTYSEQDIVSKVLRSLTPKWNSKISAIEEGRNYDQLTFDQLRESDEEEEDQDFALLTKKFTKFAKRKNLIPKKQNKPPKCFECGEIGHIKPNCPKLQKGEKDKKFKKKQKAYIS
ncbi:hypothetical protein PIB30_091403 [Stylosanthes scabra]|uniref:CCHC-type domain-containing protein n=1 Tax=Stylosanthes scabra TaxID=79078 RepID=A0ABU6VWL5_9FABA|nr:hypothetical protein [Stylosanthes scabra]